jgi:hypothetical protein
MRWRHRVAVQLVWRLLELRAMRTGAENLKPTLGGADIFFKCEHCGIALVVDPTAAGVTLKCERCDKPIIVPLIAGPRSEPGSPSSSSIEKLAELRRHLKENESQRTEINGYINQLSIQLHRWRLRLQSLDERNSQLVGEVADLDGGNHPPASS